MGWVVEPRPDRFIPGKEPVPTVWMGPNGRSGRVRKISASLGFDPRTVEAVVSRYTD